MLFEIARDAKEHHITQETTMFSQGLVGAITGSAITEAVTGIIRDMGKDGTSVVMRRVKEVFSSHLEIQGGRTYFVFLLLLLKESCFEQYRRFMLRHRRFLFPHDGQPAEGMIAEDTFVKLYVDMIKTAGSAERTRLSIDAPKKLVETVAPDGSKVKEEIALIDEAQVQKIELGVLNQLINVLPIYPEALDPLEEMKQLTAIVTQGGVTSTLKNMAGLALTSPVAGPAVSSWLDGTIASLEASLKGK